MNHDMLSYYAKRASEYERIYSKPERQEDLRRLTEILQQTFKEKEILEIACGTGYWTERIAKTASSITATDINESVLEVARAKHHAPAKVSFQLADIFNLKNEKKFQSLFGGFIWSHIKRQDLSSFIKVVNSQVEHSGIIVFVDNKFVAGSSSPITSSDEDGNTYQQRTLEDGSVYSVVKNFPSKLLIEELLKHKAHNIDYIELEYYWILRYKRP
jgi:SAM-dependent methyltransferase